MTVAGRYIGIDKFGKMRFDMPTKFDTTIDLRDTKDSHNTLSQLTALKDMCPSIDIKKKTFGVTPERGVTEEDLKPYLQEDCILKITTKNYNYNDKIGVYLRLKSIRLKNFMI